MVRLTEPQIQALCRFNRGFAVIEIGLESVDENNLLVSALLKHDIRKRFVLNQKGALVKNGQVPAQQ